MRQSQLLGNKSDIVYGFSSVEDGNMSFLWGEEKEVLKNREDFLQKLGVDPKRCVVMSVWDESVIEEITHDTPMGIGRDESTKADALITREKGIALFLLTADCLPIVLYDPIVKAVALIHAGWKSADARLAVRVVESLKRDYGSDPRNILAALGPGIHKESYIFEKLERPHADGWRSFWATSPDGTTSIDIVGYNTAQLLEAEIAENNIEASSIDTAKDSLVYSHFRAKKTGEKEGEVCYNSYD